MAKKGINKNNLSLFDIEDMQEHFINKNKLDVVKMDYIGAQSVDWQELFQGFDKLYAITFSSGLNLVVSRNFRKKVCRL